MDLAPGAAAAGVGLIACDTVGSTNAQALAYARAGEKGPLWITARAQTGGRGRRGRTWVSEPGNLFATLLLTDPAPLEINLVAAMMGLFMLGFAFFAQPLLVMAQAAAQSLF